MRSPTRRSLLSTAALAAASAAVPALALASATPDPDARLVELWRTFHAHYTWEGLPEPAEDDEALMRAYCDRWGEALEEIAATPAAGLAGIAVKARCLVHEARDGESPFKGALIDGLLADLERLVGPVPGGPGQDPAPPPPHPDAALLALAAEMDAAHARERAVRDAIGDDDGPEAEAAGDAAGDEVGRIVDRMVSLRARTVDGLRAKGRAYLWCTAGHLPDPAAEPATSCRVVASLVRDLAPAGRAGS